MAAGTRPDEYAKKAASRPGWLYHGVPSLSRSSPLPLPWSPPLAVIEFPPLSSPLSLMEFPFLSYGAPISLMEFPLPSLSWSAPSPLSHGVPLSLMEFPSVSLPWSSPLSNGSSPLSHNVTYMYCPLHPACSSPQQPCPKQPRPKQPYPKQPTFRCLPSSPNVTYTAKPLPKFQI